MFVGRERETAELEAALRQLASGAGALFLITGEPGIGKTRLVTEVVQRARATGVRIATGQCWEAGGAPALWPWTEAFERLELPFPAPAAGTTDLAEARFALFREIATGLEREAARSPCLIVLEDLHAADRSTLSLLEFIAARIRTHPIVVIGTYRDLEASLSPETSRALDRAGRAGRLFHLGRLAAPEVAAIVAEALGADPKVAAGVYETTLGNPLFVDEIVRDLRAGKSGRGGVPLGVREIIRQRLALISAEARRVLEAAAVLGVELDAADVARMEAGAATVLDDAARSGLVVARGDRVRFAHALYREALYLDLPRARRQQLHREAAKALGAGGSLSEIAHHLLEAGPDAAADAIDQSIRAARQALAMFAFEDAAALLERARAAVPTGDGALRCRVMIALGELQLRSGDPGGRALCADAAGLARELGDPALLAQAGLAYGAVFMMGGVDPVLVGCLEQALAGLPPEASLRARVMARLAAARQPSSPADRPRDIELGFAAIELGRKVADPRELLEILSSASGVFYGAVPPLIRIQYTREQERLAEQLNDVPRLLAARVRLSLDHAELGNFAAHAELATAYEELARRIGPAASPWRVPLMRSLQAILVGDFAASEQFQAEARRLEHDQPRARRAIAFHRIGFLRAAERHAELRAALPELRGLWLQMPWGTVIAEPRVAAMFGWLGADDDVRASIAQVPAGAYDDQINAPSLAMSIWATADRTHAAAIAAQLATHHGWPFYWFDCEIVELPRARTQAYLAAVLGDWEACDRFHAAALREAEAVGARHFAARMRYELGDLMLRLDREPERARALVAEGRAAAAALGLDELVALIDRRHPASAAVPAASPAKVALTLEGEFYAVATPRGPLRFKSSRGMQYLARLLDKPGVEIHVLELVGSADLADRGDAGELLDPQAFRAYRAKLSELNDIAERAEQLGNTERAERARSEMEAIAAEISRASGKGGRARRAESPVDRARSAVQRRIKDALDRIAEQDAELGKQLRRAVRTGNYCSYRESD